MMKELLRKGVVAFVLIVVVSCFACAREKPQPRLITVEPRYKGGDVREELIGYRVNKTIVFTVRDISRLDDLLNSFLEAGANYIYGIQFGTTKLRDYRDQARALALN